MNAASPARPVRAILLDFYGTVVDEDDEVIRAASAEIAAASPQEPTRADVSRVWGRFFAGGCVAAHGHAFRRQRAIERSAIQATVEHFGVSGIGVGDIADRLFAHWRAPRLFPDALTFLDGVDRPVVIVSNIDRPDLEAAIAHCGLGGRFDGVVASSDVRAYKPRPEPFAAGIDLLRDLTGGGPSLDPAAEVLHIGDSRSSDVAGANRFGIPVVRLDRARSSSSTAPRVEPPSTVVAVAATLADVLLLLDGEDGGGLLTHHRDRR